MIIRTWSIANYLNNGGELKRISLHRMPINEIKCDKCSAIWEESSKLEIRFKKWGGHFCKTCLKELNGKRIAECGRKSLSNISKEDRILNAGMGGSAAQKSVNRDVKSFTNDRWNKMNETDKKKQVMNANKGLQEKLKNPEYKRKHFEKVFNNSKIGYISKGQREVYNILIKMGYLDFCLDGILSNMKVDIIDFNRKIAVEYNGDYYHCNPRSWNKDDYNKSIKMFAYEKWNLDRNRRFKLKNLGYTVLVIWEDEWHKDKMNYINKIINLYETNQN